MFMMHVNSRTRLNLQELNGCPSLFLSFFLIQQTSGGVAGVGRVRRRPAVAAQVHLICTVQDRDR